MVEISKKLNSTHFETARLNLRGLSFEQGRIRTFLEKAEFVNSVFCVKSEKVIGRVESEKLELGRDEF